MTFLNYALGLEDFVIQANTIRNTLDAVYTQLDTDLNERNSSILYGLFGWICTLDNELKEYFDKTYEAARKETRA